MNVEDVAQAGVDEVDDQRLAVGRVQDRLGRAARACSRSFSISGRGARRLDAIAQRPLDLRGLARNWPIRRLELLGLAVGAQRLLELVGFLELPGALDIHRRRREHRALERDLVVRVDRDRPRAPAGRSRPPLPSHRRAAASPRANARPVAHSRPPAASATSLSNDDAMQPFSFRTSPNGLPCTLCPVRSKSLPAASVEYAHLDRFRADLHDAVPAVDDIAVLARAIGTLPSLSTAHLTPLARSSTPMNFNGIGGGAAVQAAAAAPAGRGVTRHGRRRRRGGGAAWSNRNGLRVAAGLVARGCPARRASPAPPAGVAAAPARRRSTRRRGGRGRRWRNPTRPHAPDARPPADETRSDHQAPPPVSEHSRRPKYGRQIERQRQRRGLLLLALRQRHVVDDDEVRTGLDLVNQLPDVVPVARERVRSRQPLERRVAQLFRRGGAALERHVVRARHLRQLQVRDAARAAPTNPPAALRRRTDRDPSTPAPGRRAWPRRPSSRRSAFSACADCSAATIRIRPSAHRHHHRDQHDQVDREHDPTTVTQRRWSAMIATTARRRRRQTAPSSRAPAAGALPARFRRLTGGNLIPPKPLAEADRRRRAGVVPLHHRAQRAVFFGARLAGSTSREGARSFERVGELVEVFARARNTEIATSMPALGRPAA